MVSDFHWLLLVAVGLSAELIFSFYYRCQRKMQTNMIFHNEFLMISSIFTMKLLQFIMLTIIKQVSKDKTKNGIC